MNTKTFSTPLKRADLESLLEDDVQPSQLLELFASNMVAFGYTVQDLTYLQNPEVSDTVLIKGTALHPDRGTLESMLLNHVLDSKALSLLGQVAQPVERFEPEPLFSLDIECLGFHPNSSIIQIGVCAYFNKKFHTVEVLVQPDYERSEQNVMDWWKTQAHGATLMQEAEELGAPTLDLALKELDNKLIAQGIPSDLRTQQIWWFRGPQMDESLIRHQLGEHNVAWKHYMVEDERTLDKEVAELGFTHEDMMLHAGPGKPAGVPHMAGYDAEIQARRIVGAKRILQRLKKDALLFRDMQVAKKTTL